MLMLTSHSQIGGIRNHRSNGRLCHADLRDSLFYRLTGESRLLSMSYQQSGTPFRFSFVGTLSLCLQSAEYAHHLCTLVAGVKGLLRACTRNSKVIVYSHDVKKRPSLYWHLP